MGMRKIFYFISGGIILICIGSLVTRGLNPGIDFSGGRSYIIQFDQPVKTADVAKNLVAAFGEAPQVVTYGNDRQVRIITKYKINETDVDNEIETALYDGLKGMVGNDVTKEQFLSKYKRSSETVGPTIAADMKSRAAWAVGFSLIIMFLYIFMRFKNWQYGSLLGQTAVHNGCRSIVHSLYSDNNRLFRKRYGCGIRQVEGISSSSQETSGW
jgi:SecD/SecF fusion protein